jgi:hypothetical protein
MVASAPSAMKVKVKAEPARSATLGVQNSTSSGQYDCESVKSASQTGALTAAAIPVHVAIVSAAKRAFGLTSPFCQLDRAAIEPEPLRILNTTPEQARASVKTLIMA